MRELILPDGYRPSDPYPVQHGTIVNETDWPDDLVEHAVKTHFIENASVLGANSSTFNTYTNRSGSLLARSKWAAPNSVVEEICLARELAERDDDCASTIGAMLAVAFGEGYQHTHEDETTTSLFDEMAKVTDLDSALEEIYREYLIAGQFTTVSLFSRGTVQFRPHGADRNRSRSVVMPRVSVIPSEQIRVFGDDTFGTAPLYYRPRSAEQEQWLNEYFEKKTSAGRKSEMRRQNPVLTSLLLERKAVNSPQIDALFLTDDDPATGQWVYRLNPSMVARSTMPKGAWQHPRPLLTRNFPLLEAKRLLNLMDHALLEGGSNFLVVARKGSDARPALPAEISNLHEVIRRASRSGVVVGDHRLNIDIITPDLTELLNPNKRRMIGRKLAGGLLRLPDFQDASGSSGQAALSDIEVVARVITSDRRKIHLHLERDTYRWTANRNSASFNTGAASLWFPKVILNGAQYFTDMVLKLRDRGDIPRKFAVEAAGFSYQHAVEQRRREKKNGDDDVLTPPPVPFTEGGPQDNNSGRPKGGSPDNGRPGAKSGSGPDPAAPKRTITRNAGETVKAVDDGENAIEYVGVLTEALLESYPDLTVGRITSNERQAMNEVNWQAGTVASAGTAICVPVNGSYDLEGVRVLRLADDLAVAVGRRPGNGPMMARAFLFRANAWDEDRAERFVERAGWAP